jgi:hypothetical protein
VTGQLGASVGTAAIVPEWNVAKVQRVALTRSGSNYRATVKPFLTGIANPLATAFAADRSLLVATGPRERSIGSALAPLADPANHRQPGPGRLRRR